MSNPSTDEIKKNLEAIRNNPDICGKYGLKGDNGLVPWVMPDGKIGVWSVNMPYDSCGKMFVDIVPNNDNFERCLRMNPEEAAKHADKIVRCSFEGCREPAVRLDHHHPYDDAMTNCEEHLDWFLKQQGDQDEKHVHNT